MPRFNITLTAARATAGYRTAYSFYHSNGGRRVFPFTYAYYLKIERGNSLPRPEWLALIMRTMRIISTSQKAALVKDYLKDLAGASYDDLFAPFLTEPEEPPVQKSLRRLRGRLAEHMTPRQLLTLAVSPEAYGCFLILVNSGIPMDAGDLAESLGAPERACATALRDLVRHGLAQVRSGGLYEIAHFGRHYTFPNDAGSMEVRQSIHAHTEKLFSRAGTLVYDGWVSARMPHAELSSTIKGLQEIFQVVAGNDMPIKASSDASLYMIEGKIRKLGGR